MKYIQKDTRQTKLNMTAVISRPARHGRRWTEGEDEHLEWTMTNRVPVEEIAAIHERTVGAVVIRAQNKATDLVYNEKYDTELASEIFNVSVEKINECIAWRIVKATERKAKVPDATVVCIP